MRCMTKVWIEEWMRAMESKGLADSVKGRCNSVGWIGLKEAAMHDIVAVLVFVAMVLAPCAAALTAKMHDAG